MSGRVRCAATVYDGWGRPPCSRAGVVERDGKWWCRQHDPEAKKARQAATQAKWDHSSKVRDAAYAVEAAERALVNACLELEGDPLPIGISNAIDRLRSREAALEALKEPQNASPVATVGP